MAASSLIKLSSLRSGQSAVVEFFEVQNVEHNRLHEMGFRVGELVKMVMPGCPCAVAVGDTRIMVRAEALEAIGVFPLD